MISSATISNVQMIVRLSQQRRATSSLPARARSIPAWVWGVAGDSTGTGLRTAIVGNTTLTSTIAVGPLSLEWSMSFTDIPIITSQAIFVQETQGRTNDQFYVTAYSF